VKDRYFARLALKAFVLGSNYLDPRLQRVQSKKAVFCGIKILGV
jgi:hypothetical protein